MKKLILIIAILLFSIVSVNAHYLGTHAVSTVDGRNTPVDNPSINYKLCNKYPKECFAGDVSADCSVVYYLTPQGRNKFYRGTHSIATYYNCLRIAGNNERQRAFCIGIMLHLSQDVTSHGLDEKYGYTASCIKSYAGTNLYLHSTCERAFERQLLETRADKTEILKMASDSYDLLIEEPEFQNLLNQASGLDLTDACKIVGANVKALCPEGVCEGTESYDAIYKSQELNVPSYLFFIPVIAFFVVVILMLLIVKFGKTWWKWILMLFLILLLIPSSYVSYYVMFNRGGAYKAYISIQDSLGSYIEVPDTSIWLKESVQNTLNSLQTGEPRWDGKLIRDASGLTRYDDETKTVISGPLDEATASSTFIRWSLLIGFVGFIIFLCWKTFRKKRK